MDELKEIIVDLQVELKRQNAKIAELHDKGQEWYLLYKSMTRKYEGLRYIINSYIIDFRDCRSLSSYQRNVDNFIMQASKAVSPEDTERD